MAFLRYLLIFLVLIVLASMAFGQDLEEIPAEHAAPTFPNTGMVANLDAAADSFPNSYLPEDFLPHVPTRDFALPVSTQPSAQFGAQLGAQLGAQPATTATNPMSWDVDMLPRAPAVGGAVANAPAANAPAVGAVTSLPPGQSVSGQSVAGQALPVVETGTPAQSALQAALAEPGFWSGVPAQHVLVSLYRIVGAVDRLPPAQTYLLRALLQPVLAQNSPGPAGLPAPVWLAERAQLLLKLGLASEAYQLVQPIPEQELLQSPELAQAWTLTTLYAGQTARACGFVQQQVLNADEPFWRQTLMVCQAIQEEFPALQLSLQLARDGDVQTDPQLNDLLLAILHNTPVPEIPEDSLLTPLQAVLFGAYPSLIRPELFAQLPDITLLRVVNTAALDLLVRTQAAEFLVQRQGSIANIGLLTQLYDGFEFDLMAAKDPIGTAKQEPIGTLARALLWQAAGMGSLPSLRAESLLALWDRAQQDQLSQLVFALQPQQRNIFPQPQLAWVTPRLIPILVATNDPLTAETWLESLAANRTVSPRILAQQADLQRTIHLATGSWTNTTVQDWWQAFQQAPQRAQPLHLEQARRLLAMADALQLSVPLAYWQDLHHLSNLGVQYPPQPDHIWLRLLAQHLNQQETGAALLMLLEPLANLALAEMSPQTLANVLSGLEFIGLTPVRNQLAALAYLAQPQLEPAPSAAAPALVAVTPLADIQPAAGPANEATGGVTSSAGVQNSIPSGNRPSDTSYSIQSDAARNHRTLTTDALSQEAGELLFPAAQNPATP